MKGPYRIDFDSSKVWAPGFEEHSRIMICTIWAIGNDLLEAMGDTWPQMSKKVQETFQRRIDWIIDGWDY